MSRITTQLVQALRNTADRLRAGAPYQWGHAGACNCGHLAQTVTHRSSAAIYQDVGGEWSEYLQGACPVSGQPIDDVGTSMIRFGFSPSELADLEWLGDERVLARLPGGKRYLQRNVRDDVVLYLETWATLLDEGSLDRAA